MNGISLEKMKHKNGEIFYIDETRLVFNYAYD